MDAKPLNRRTLEQELFDCPDTYRRILSDCIVMLSSKYLGEKLFAHSNLSRIHQGEYTLARKDNGCMTIIYWTSPNLPYIQIVGTVGLLPVNLNPLLNYQYSN